MRSQKAESTQHRDDRDTKHAEENKKEGAMRKEKIDAGKVVREAQDVLMPVLRFRSIERAVYYHLLRHTRLEGRRSVATTLHAVGRGAGLSYGSARHAIRALVDKGVVRATAITRKGHVIEVRLPNEIPGCREVKRRPEAMNLEAANFFRDRGLREAIHRREKGKCFYCRRRLQPRTRTLDHVVAWARGIGEKRAGNLDSYRNLVSCCAGCNFGKGGMPAFEFLNKLYRQGTINTMTLNERRYALRELKWGKLKPVFEGAKAA